MKTMSIEAIMERFNLLDLCGALADFLTQVDSQDSFHIGGCRIGSIDSVLYCPLVVCTDSAKTAQTAGNPSKVCTESKQSMQTPYRVQGQSTDSTQTPSK